MIDKFKKFTESADDLYDDEYYGHNTDGMEHIAYLLRTTLRSKSIDDFTVDYSGYDICVSVFCYELERLKDMIKIFDTMGDLNDSIIPQYDLEFDMYQNRKGDSILEFNFYLKNNK